MGVLANLFVVVLVILMGLAGFRDGAWFTMYALVRNAIAFVCAMTFAGPLGRLFEGIITKSGHAREYFFCIAFALIVAVVIVLARWLKVTYTVPHVPCGVWPDRIAGPALGLVNGMVVTGIVFVLWSLVPFAKYLPGDVGSIKVNSKLDTGAAMLRFYKYVERRAGGSQPFLLDDEPLLVDVNGNGRFENDVAGEEYDDRNVNGVWDRGWMWKYKNQGQVLPSDLEGGYAPPSG
jgi:hypothetical protein